VARYVRRFQRDGEPTEAQDDQSGSRRTAAVGRVASIERQGRTGPFASHTATSKIPALRLHRTNSSRTARGPTPGTGKAVNGSDARACPRRRRLARNQRLRLDGASSTWRGPIVPEAFRSERRSASCYSGSVASRPCATSSRIALRNLSSCAALSGDSGQNDLSTIGSETGRWCGRG
jgi:hypothetical protein